MLSISLYKQLSIIKNLLQIFSKIEENNIYNNYTKTLIDN